jgi:hypothetical protein
MSQNPELLDDVFLQKEELSEVERLRRYQLKWMQAKVNRAGNFLFAIGIITLLMQVFYSINKVPLNNIWFTIALGALYIGLGFLSNIKPIIGLCIGLGLYVGLYLYTNNFHLMYNSGFIIRAFVTIILVTGIINAIRIEKFKTKYQL